jgi:hypothetical protein
MSSSTQLIENLNQNQFYNNLNSIMNEILLEGTNDNFNDKHGEYKTTRSGLALSSEEFFIVENNNNVNETFISTASSNQILENSENSLLKSSIFMINSQSDVIKEFRHAFLEVYLEKNKVGRKSKKNNSSNGVICTDSAVSISTPTTPLTPKMTSSKMLTNSIDSKYVSNCLSLNSFTSSCSERRDRISCSKSKISSRLGNRNSIKKVNNLLNITNKEAVCSISKSFDSTNNNNKLSFLHTNPSKCSNNFSYLTNTCAINTINENIYSSSSNYYDDGKLSSLNQTTSNSLPNQHEHQHFSSYSSFCSPYSLNNYGESVLDPSPDSFENEFFDKRDAFVYNNDLSACSIFDTEKKRFGINLLNLNFVLEFFNNYNAFC